jgi:hypothetical protein
LMMPPLYFRMSIVIFLCFALGCRHPAGAVHALASEAIRANRSRSI